MREMQFSLFVLLQMLADHPFVRLMPYYCSKMFASVSSMGAHDQEMFSKLGIFEHDPHVQDDAHIEFWEGGIQYLERGRGTAIVKSRLTVWVKRDTQRERTWSFLLSGGGTTWGSGPFSWGIVDYHWWPRSLRRSRLLWLSRLCMIVRVSVEEVGRVSWERRWSQV